ncbi:fluoride efflux transporter CrcB [Agrobacterium sp. P15N1-A]|uniref:fluoride efflux transporter CrcB n=1 Tax=Agrobacterium sp. P15N1-A TaxID=3342820 RepID=UPI0037CE06A1
MPSFSFLPYVVVFVGAGLGGAARHGVNQMAANLIGLAFPYGTLAINIVGSTAMGLLTAYFSFRGYLPQELRLFLATGVLGGFTTFSTFSLDTVALWERGEPGLAALYALLSLLLSIAGLVTGLVIVRALSPGATI